MLIAILLQYYSNNESQLAYKIFKNNSTVKTESNLLDDDNTILSHLLHHLQKIDKLYFLVSESFLDNHTTLKNLTSNSNKLVDLTHPKIKQHFKIEISAKSDTTRYLTLLYEKILGSNKNISSLNIEERIDLLLQIIKTNDPGKLIHTQNNTLPQQISDFLKSLPQNSLLDNDKIQAIELFHQIFYSDNPSILVITGSAGTGKSTLINYLIKYAQFLAKDISYKLMAPPGKAARHRKKNQHPSIHHS
jgi:deoxyadenosine/deoxycytidine kinase